MTPEAESRAPAWRETLFVPVGWWVIAAFFLASVFAAVAYYLGIVNGSIATAAATALVLATLLSYGGAKVIVDEQGLRVGPNHIEWQWVGGATAHDKEESRHRLGPGADARAHLAIRPYLPESVEVTLNDRADPHPYWLVGSRDATGLAAAINCHLQARQGSGAHE